MFKLRGSDYFASSTFNPIQYDPIHEETIKCILKFTNKNIKSFDFLHFSDLAKEIDKGVEIHTIPFKDGFLFSFNNIFSSIDLIDSLMKSFNIVVLEFQDKNHLFM